MSRLRWLQRERQKSWPATTGRIDSAKVGTPRRVFGLELPSSRGATHDAILSYSYESGGQKFQGEYRESFASEEEALDFLRDLEGQTISVQYHPNKLNRSVLLKDTVDGLLRNRPPRADAVDWKESLPGWLQRNLGAFASLAMAGLLLSVGVHIISLSGRQPFGFLRLLHLGMFVVFLPALLIARKRPGAMRRKDFWKTVTQGAPDGLRYLLYFFLAYAMLNGFLSVWHPPTLRGSNLDPVHEWSLFSSNLDDVLLRLVRHSICRASFIPRWTVSKKNR